MNSHLLAAVVGLLSLTLASGQATCNPKFWSAGHDFKNMQYSHINASSVGDCCTKCSTYSDKTIGQCKFWTFDGHGTCWLKSNNKGYRKGSADITCGSVDDVPFPTQAPTPPPTKPMPAPPTMAPTPWDGKPVQVYIMMGQSNMLGEGKILGDINGTLEHAVTKEGLYPYLWNTETKNWAVQENTRNVFIMASGNQTFAESELQHNEWMSPYNVPDPVPPSKPGSHDTIGPEFGISHFGGWKQDNVMLLKSCIGDRALGWDLLPPGTQRWNYKDASGTETTYAGYGDSPEKWPADKPKPAPMGWYAGEQWDGDVANAQYILSNISLFFPGASKYEIAGFFWWQGDKDSRDMGLSTRYEFNLVNLIKTLRTTFKAPNAPFVTASLGQTKMGSTGGDGLILDAMLNVANGTKYPEFAGNVAAVYSNPLMVTPSASGAHYGGDARTYMNIGQAMGEAMAKLKQA